MRRYLEPMINILVFDEEDVRTDSSFAYDEDPILGDIDIVDEVDVPDISLGVTDPDVFDE